MSVKPAFGRLCLQATRKPAGARSIEMLDLIMLVIGLGFFALAVGYAYACERL
jgi:hypothetical protein